MKVSLFVAGLLIAVSTTSAIADSGPYISASGGLSIFHDNDVEFPGVTGNANIGYKTGYGFNAAAGYKLNDFRLEAEFGYRKADIKYITHPFYGDLYPNVNGTQTVMSYMLNGYYDIDLGLPSVTFLLGAGLGMLNGEVENHDVGTKADDNVLGYQITAGLSYNINRNVSIDLYYRFQGASYPFEMAAGSKVSYGSSNINGGIRYNF